MIARGRYRLQRSDAQDAFQEAVLAWMEVSDRYADEKEPLRVFLGVFHNKCLELIDKTSRERRKLKTPSRPPEAPTGTRLGGALCGSEPSALHAVVQREEGQQILTALSALHPEAQEIFRLLAEEDISRQELIELLNLNPNTMDSRLRKFRQELRRVLQRIGIYI